MSWKHCAWASSQIAGSPINKLVLMMMADATSHDNPLLVLKIKTLASKCEASESSVKRAIAELEHRRLIARVSRFFENNQQASGYILVHEGMSPGDLSLIVKSANTGGCHHVLRAFHWDHGFMEGEYDPAIQNPLGSQRAQGGVTLDPGWVQSDLPNNTEFSFPSSSKPKGSLAPLTPSVPADEQQPERSRFISPSASTPGLSSEPSHAEQVLPVRQARAKKTSTVLEIPENLKTPEFISAWGEWIEYRRVEMRKPLTEALAQRQLKNLSQFSSQVAVSAIKKSMSSGWMGLFPEKEVPQKRSSGWGVPSSTGQALSPLERQAREAEQAKNYVPML